MALVVICLTIALLVLSALAAALCGHRDRVALAIGTAGAVAACAAGLVAAIAALTGVPLPASPPPIALGAAALPHLSPASLRAAWPLPLGEIHVGLDPLSAFFLVCIYLVSGLAAVYGHGYLRPLAGHRRLAGPAFFFNLLVAAMAGVVIARDAVLFLFAWEIMAIASFFLVTFDHEREPVRRAGMTYLIATHAGTVFVLLLFGLLARHSGSLDFDAFLAAGPPATATLCFLAALLGFGAKAGFWPMHIWLPDAHPAAPSHVSAVMSGVMIKVGVYGLARSLTFLPEPPAFWGGLLIVTGAVSAVAGVLHALTQHELKRLLAYHSVENIGIIGMGLGLGLLGQSSHSPAVATLGYAGALLHVLNHGLFKGTLFQAAGSVLQATGTGDLDRLGALIRRMPVTGALFLAASVAICGLPPMNGFVSELLVYLSAFRGGSDFPGTPALMSVLVIPTLALVGGLAAACFVKAFGVVFLGEPRSDATAGAKEPARSMIAAGGCGALLCLLIGVWPEPILRLLAPAVGTLTAFDPAVLSPAAPLFAVTRVAAVLVLAVGSVTLLRALLLRGRERRAGATWGCGYDRPTPRMQYTAASFAEPVLSPFSVLIHARVERQGPAGLFPAAARYEEHLGDLAGERILVPASRALIRGLGRIRILQRGRIQVYLAYVLATLVLLLAWTLAGGGTE